MKVTSSIVMLSLSLITAAVHADATVTPNVLLNKTVKKINLNTATVEILSHSIKGIGKKRAEAMVQYRQKHGNFKSLTDLAAVRGVGHKFVQAHWSELQAVFVL